MALSPLQRSSGSCRPRSTSASPTPGNDDGDVPGWVLITLMTAGLVAVLWGAAGTKLGSLLNTALDSVTPQVTAGP